MDSFFSKKGITLSKPAPLSSRQSNDTLIRSSEQLASLNITPLPFTPYSRINGDVPCNTNPTNTQINFVSHQPSRNQSFQVKPKKTITLHNQKDINSSFSSNPQWKQFSYIENEKKNQNQISKDFIHPDDFIQMHNQFPSTTSIDDQTSKSFMMKTRDNDDMTSTNQESRSSVFLLPNLDQEERLCSLGNITPIKSIGNFEEDKTFRIQLEQALLRQKAKQQALKLMQKQKQALIRELREGKGIPGHWIDEKIKMMAEVEGRNKIIKQLEIKLIEKQKQYKSKIYFIQCEKEKLESSKNTLQIQTQNTRKLLQVQRRKNDTSQQKMNKLIFFQQDLIHAKDYDKLKKEMEDSFNENAKMFQDHQKFILEVSQHRRRYEDRLEQIQEELSKLKGEAFQWRAKIQKLGINSEDKRDLIKLQHDINYMIKKSEQSMELLLGREQDLEQARLQVKELTQRENKRTQNSQNMLDNLNIQQFSQTIALYELRISDLNVKMEAKDTELQKQKKINENLTAELRNAREDRHINSLKEKSSENNLKNELMVLQHSLQSEIDLNKKKIVTLQDNIQRKIKQISQKDKFIKQFLIGRAKLIEEGSFEQILESVRSYFNVTEERRAEPQSQPVAVDV